MRFHKRLNRILKPLQDIAIFGVGSRSSFSIYLANRFKNLKFRVISTAVINRLGIFLFKALRLKKVVK